MKTEENKKQEELNNEQLDNAVGGQGGIRSCKDDVIRPLCG